MLIGMLLRTQRSIIQMSTFELTKVWFFAVVKLSKYVDKKYFEFFE